MAWHAARFTTHAGLKRGCEKTYVTRNYLAMADLSLVAAYGDHRHGSYVDLKRAILISMISGIVVRGLG